jgi:hypothetical protein
MSSFAKIIAGTALLAASSIAGAQQIIGDMTAADASVKGSVVLVGTNTRLMSGSAVNAGATAASVKLARGGELRICPHTGVAITTSQTGKDLQIALNTGAIETHYSLKTSADSILTPDFRILFPGPGTFHFAIASDPRGNTCVRALSGNSSSLVVTEVLGDGIYQVQPTDQVYFRNGRVANADAFVPPDCGCGPPQPAVMRAETEQPEIPLQPAQQVTQAPPPPANQQAASQTSGPPRTVAPKPTGPAFVTEAQNKPPQPPPAAPKNVPKVDVGGVPPTAPQAMIAAYGNPVGEAPQQQTPPPNVNSTNLQLDVPLVFSAESVIPPPPMTLSLQSMAPLNLNQAALLPIPNAPEQPRREAAAAATQEAPPAGTPKKKNNGVFGKIGGFFSSLFGGGKK